MSKAGIVVQKYGGSSLSDISGIHRVAERVVETVQQGRQVVVVVSAMGNTTNELLSLAKSISPNPRRRELDLLVSVGERVSMTLLAMAIADKGFQAKSFTGSQSGIITDEQHVAASIIEVRPYRIREALAEGCVVIVAGFQGVSRTREVTTLGRGGSDTTAVALAAALQADYCEICSDVDGVYSADPRIISTAKKLPDLGLDVAWELSRAGAKVLSAAALEYAKLHGIALCANATSKPTGQGTFLRPQVSKEIRVAITGDDKLIWVTSSNQVISQQYSHALRYCWNSGEDTHYLLDTRNLHTDDLLAGEQWQNIATVTVVDNSKDPLVIKKSLAALDGIHIYHWWYRTSVWTALVTRDKAILAQQRLHQIFVRE